MSYPTIRQHSEEDCGAACLASIAKHYGRTFTLARVREAVGTGQLGTSLLGLKRGAEALGFNARGVKASPDIIGKLRDLPLPAIVHWQGYHWVVLYGQRGKKYVIADPAVGIRYISKKELLEHWSNGVMLLLELDATRFFAQPNDSTGNIGRFLRFVWRDRSILAEALLINVVLGVLSLSFPFLLQILTDDVLIRGDTQVLTGVILAVALMSLMSNGLRLIQSNLIAHITQRLQLGLVLEFGRQLLRLPLAYFESHRSGEVTSRIKDIQEINQLIAQAVIGLPSQCFVAAISFCLMLFYSWKLAAFSLVFAVVMTLSTLIFLPILDQKTRSLIVLEAENQGLLVETFKGALTLKTSSAAPQLWEELQSRFVQLTGLTLRTIQIAIVNETFSGVVFGLGSIALLWFGSSLVINRELTIGQLLAFNSLNATFLGFIGAVISFVDEFVQVKTAVNRLMDVIDASSEDQNDGKKPVVTLSGQADIVCTDLTFHHIGRVDLLQDFSLTLPGGKVTALIGQSGCGKSTLAKLIAGLYVPESGSIRIGSYYSQDVALDSLRQQVVLVPQEPHFWSRSIVENFRLGSPYLAFEEIIEACQLTGADEFISQLPDKYQTVLGEFGVNLSGGQRQRLAIARAIVTHPPILILDEATAGLDPQLEAQVLDRVLSQRSGKTTLLISHRHRVICRADWVVLLDRGHVKIQGTPADLATQEGSHLEFLTP